VKLIQSVNEIAENDVDKKQYRHLKLVDVKQQIFIAGSRIYFQWDCLLIVAI